MKKNLRPVVPQSASATVPIGGMRLDDFAVESRPLNRLDPLNEALASTLVERPPLPIQIPHQAPAVRATKMIATPIDAGLRKRLRELRNDYEISEAFIIETALQEYFDGRPLAEIAAELRERGGRLRRPKS
jgi:hypothetical protein